MMSRKETTRIVVAGHICLDILVDIGNLSQDALVKGLEPGNLVKIGGAKVTTGGTVSNTGIALHRLGMDVRLVARVGDDAFGEAVANVVEGVGRGLGRDLVRVAGEPTSYTLVFNPLGRDRSFLHCPGVNDTFCADDVDFAIVGQAGLLHLGYPPLMRNMWIDKGGELAKLFSRAKEHGMTTSLDMAWPDPASEAGQANWGDILASVLPVTDVFLPSIDEALFMVDRRTYERLASGEEKINADMLDTLSQRLIDQGPAVVGLKLGRDGLYVRTADNAQRFARMGASAPADVANWMARRMISPCFEIKVSGTTGAGDSTIAGFLAGLVKGMPIEFTMNAACGTGACNCENPLSAGMVPHWDALVKRVPGWKRQKVSASLKGWAIDPSTGLYVSPEDRQIRRR